MSTREQADGRNGVDPLQTIDAMVWASEFMRLFGHRKDEIDTSLMLAWFANAIMRGFDEATRRNESALADARRAVWEEAAKVAEQAIPRAHTYASENADIYRAQDDAKRIVIKAIRAKAQAAQEERV